MNFSMNYEKLKFLAEFHITILHRQLETSSISCFLLEETKQINTFGKNAFISYCNYLYC